MSDEPDLGGVMRRVKGYLELMRPLNGLIALASVWAGGFISSGGLRPVSKLAITSVSALLILSSGNAINDWCDVEIDRINRPSRPIPSGRASRGGALALAVICAVFGIALSTLVSLPAFRLAFSALLLLFLYAFKLKGTPLMGNGVVAALTGLIFVAGGIAVGRVGGSLVPAAFASLFTFAREVVKDMEDVEGDRKAGARTAPVVWGLRRAGLISAAAMILLILITPLPALMLGYSWRYVAVVGIGVNLPLIWCAASIARSPSKAPLIQRVMKFDIFAALLAICLK